MLLRIRALLHRTDGPVACAGRALRLVGVREGHSAASRLFPSEVLPGKLFLTDLPAAAQLAQRADVRAQLKLAHVVTIMAELPREMAAVVARAEPAPPISGAAPGAYQHTFFACHDASGADIKQHFAAAHALIDEVAARGGAVLVHCSKGVSRSASERMRSRPSHHAARAPGAAWPLHTARLTRPPSPHGPLLQPCASPT